MTEAEIIEVVTSNWANAISAFTVFVTFTFAYLVTAHMAGSVLSKPQAVLASVLYLVASTSAMLSLVGSHQVMRAAMYSSPTVIDDLLFADPNFWTPYMVPTMLLSQLASLYFMFDVRRKGGDT
jgi:hypothetical protein